MADLPRNAWILMPSYKPAEVTLVEEYRPWGGDVSGHYTDKGKWVRVGEDFPTKEAAIAAGLLNLEEQEATLEKRRATIIKRRAALDKALVS